MARYQAVSSRSELLLEASSSIHPIHTAVRQVEGYFEAEFDVDGKLIPSKETGGRLQVAVDNLKSGNALIDRTMQGRLNTRRFPTIKAELVEIGEANGQGHYLASGDVTFHGVTRRLQDKLIIKQLDDHTFEIRGQTEVDVRNFKVEPPRLLMLKVEPNVIVKLTLIVKRSDSGS